MPDFSARSQAQKLLIDARSQVMAEVQIELNFGARKLPCADLTYCDGFSILTNAIQKLYRRGE